MRKLKLIGLLTVSALVSGCVGEDEESNPPESVEGSAVQRFTYSDPHPHGFICLPLRHDGLVLCMVQRGVR
jgi:hypothetical protein